MRKKKIHVRLLIILIMLIILNIIAFMINRNLYKYDTIGYIDSSYPIYEGLSKAYPEGEWNRLDNNRIEFKDDHNLYVFNIIDNKELDLQYGKFAGIEMDEIECMIHMMDVFSKDNQNYKNFIDAVRVSK